MASIMATPFEITMPTMGGLLAIADRLSQTQTGSRYEERFPLHATLPIDSISQQSC